MPYIGNTIRAADDYRLIDDISSSFNGSTTSFALQVAGSSPVPFPKSPQQVLISVNGVIQEPDPTGASGFNLVGTNIVFSSAPTNGHAFFGIIYATADYLNAGGNFPSGSLGAPSFTFIGDENTGLYRKGGGSVGFVSDATEIANFDSNGITISSGNLILGDSGGTNDDRIKLGSSGDLEIYHNGSNSYIDDAGTGNLFIRSNEVRINKYTNEFMIRAIADGAVELYHNNTKTFETTAEGVTFDTGSSSCVVRLTSNSDAVTVLQAFNSDFNIKAPSGGSVITQVNGNEDAIKAVSNGAVELYHNNVKKLETVSGGATITGVCTATSFAGDGSSLSGINTDLVSDTSPQLGGNLDTNSFEISFDDNHSAIFGDSSDLKILHTGSESRIDFSATAHNLKIMGSGGSSHIDLQPRNGHSSVKAIANGAAELYYDNSKKFETLSTGIDVTGACGCDSLNVNSSLGNNGKLAVKMDTNKHIAFSHSQSEVSNVPALVAFQDNGSLAEIGFRGVDVRFAAGSAERWRIDSSGHFVPQANNSYDIGTTSNRVRNIYTNDLNLSNKGSQNDVDSTWGDYTIQEGFEDLYLINHRTGKRFKFNLTEVS